MKQNIKQKNLIKLKLSIFSSIQIIQYAGFVLITFS